MHLLPIPLQHARDNRPTGIDRLKALAQAQTLSAGDIALLQSALNLARADSRDHPLLIVPGHTGSSLLSVQAHWGWQTQGIGQILASLSPADASIRTTPLHEGGPPIYGGVFVAPSHEGRSLSSRHALNMDSNWTGDPSWPERDPMMTQVAQAAALCRPHGLVLALLPPHARELAPNHYGSVLAHTQVLGIVMLGARHLWVLRRRPEAESARLAKLVTGQHILMRESYARLRAEPGPVEMLEHLRQQRAEHEREARLERSRTGHLQRHGNITPGYAEFRPGGMLRAYWGGWITISLQEQGERLALEQLGRLTTQAAYGPPANTHEQAAQTLERQIRSTFPTGLLNQNRHPVITELKRLQDMRRDQRGSDPLTRMMVHANYGTIDLKVMQAADVQQDTAEATLYAADYAYTSHGWVPEHTYYNDFVMDLIRAMPLATTAHQQLALTRQESRLRTALEHGRAADHTWLITSTLVPTSLIHRFVAEMIREDAPDLESAFTHISAHEQVDPHNHRIIQRSFRTDRKAAAPLARALNMWMAGQQPEGIIGTVLKRAEEQFHAWMDERSAEDLAPALSRRDETIRPVIVWPTKPTQHLLAGWNRRRKPTPWQQAATWRFMTQRRGINAMRTGAGKTTAQIMAMLSQVRLGHRAAIIVPTEVMAQWHAEIQACTHVSFAVIGCEREASGQWVDTGSSAMIDLQLHQATSSGAPLLLISEQAATRLRITDDTLIKILMTEAGRFGQVREQFMNCVKQLAQDGTNALSTLCIGRGGLNMSVYNAYRTHVTARAIQDGRLTPRGAALSTEGIQAEIKVIQAEQEDLRLAKERESDAYEENAQQLRILHFLLEGMRQLEQERNPLQTTWDELNISALTVDELHEYKGTDNGSMNHVRYAGTLQYALRAQHMLLRARAVQARGGATLGATATPWKNSLQDIYNEMDIVNPDLWTGLGITNPAQFMGSYLLTGTRRRRRILILGGELHTINDTETYVQRLRQVAQLRAQVLPSMDISQPGDISGVIPSLSTEYMLYATTAEAAEVIRVTGTDPVRSLADYGNRPELALKQAEAIQQTPQEESRIRRLYAQMALGEPRVLELITQRAELDMEMIDPVTYQGYVSPKVAGMLDCLSEQIATSTKGVLIYCDITNMSGGADPTPNGYNFHDKLKRLICERTGLSPTQVGIMNGESSGAQQRYELTQLFNSGVIRVMIGNEVSMGQSQNLQGNTGYIHHLDQALNPARHAQRTGRAQRIGNPHPTIHEIMHMGTRGLDAIMADRNRHKRSTYDQLWIGSETSVRNPELEAIPSINRLRLLAIDDPDMRRHHEMRLARREDRDTLSENRRTVTRDLQNAQLGHAATHALKQRGLHASTEQMLRSRVKRGQAARQRLKAMGINWEDTLGSDGRSGVYMPNLGRVLYDGDPVILSGNTLHLTGLPPGNEPDLSGMSHSRRNRAIKAHQKRVREHLSERSAVGFGYLHVWTDGTGTTQHGVWMPDTYVYGSRDLLEEAVIDLDGAERVMTAAISGQTLPRQFWPKRDQDWDDGVGEYLSEYHDGLIAVHGPEGVGIVNRGQADYTALLTGRYRSLTPGHPLEGAAVLAGPQADLGNLRSMVVSALLINEPGLGESQLNSLWMDIQTRQQLWDATLEISVPEATE